MKVLLDHNVSRRLRTHLSGHLVLSAESLKLNELKNGELLSYAERNDFDVMVTADQSIFYQQNNELRRISLVVVNTNRWTTIREHAEEVLAAVNGSEPGSFVFLDLRPART
jgi:predicted nuclease of predicted toxin-antitoxin system